MNEKKKIALYVDGSRLTNINCDDSLLNGNPGIGGGEYITTCLSILLSKKEMYDVYLYTPSLLTSLNKNVKQIISYSLNDSIYLFNKFKEGTFICCPRGLDPFLNDCHLSINVITWEHCYFDNNILNAIDCNPKIIKNIALTKTAKEEKKRYSNLYSKTEVFGNFTSLDRPKRIFNDNGRIDFAFVGALVPVKGFHILTKWWPSVVKKIPNAHLTVYGSEHMYFPNNKLGKFNLANENYEKIFLYPLLKHNLMNTVTFKGAVPASELFDELKYMDVGLVGISGESETFCISAIDFGTIGIPVICRDIHGLKDTVPNGLGCRFKNKKDFVKYCVSFANDESINIKMGNEYHSFVENNFGINNFSKLWDDLFINLNEIDVKNYSKKRKHLVPLSKQINNFVFRIKWYLERKRIYCSKTIKEKY